MSARKIIAASLATLLVAACEIHEVKTVSSPIKHERGVVRELVYTPSKEAHGSTSDIGIDTDGNLTFSSGRVVIRTPSVWATVFECEHRTKFVTEGSDSAHEALYNKLNELDSVDISYAEIWRYTIQDTNRDRVPDTTLRELLKYDFLDANKLPTPSRN